MRQNSPLIRNLIIAALVLVTALLLNQSIVGTELDELDQQLQATKSQLDSTVKERDSAQQRLKALEKLKNQYQSSLTSMQNNYALTNSQIQTTAQSINEKDAEITKIEEQITEINNLVSSRNISIKGAIRSMYISQTPGWLAAIMADNQVAAFAKSLIYQRSITASLQNEIDSLKRELSTIADIRDVLDQLKTELEAQRQNLISQSVSLQNQINSTQKNIASAQGEMQNLNQALVGLDQQVSALTQKQRDILNAKAAAALASTSVGNVEVDPTAIEKDAPKDGNVYFSFWTYGYPHRVGMNQYGAFGRSKAGQTVDQILNAYYYNVSIVDWSMPEMITITGSGGNQTISFEDDYLMGIGEMPSCWGAPDRGGLEALKAQAIAARTYALAYTSNGANPICTTQACQVYVGSSKVTGTCGEYWRAAVLATRGKVIVQNNQPITAWYASTAGGFTLSSAEVWGGNRDYVRGIADLDPSGNAYDGKDHGNSPWYHKAWGNQPWLSIAQVTDLFNAALLPESFNNQLALAEKGGYSPEQVVSQLIANGIEPISSFNAIEIIDQNGRSGANTAQVGKVRVYYSSGKVAEVTGSRFKFVYNLRSPGTNALWTTRFDVLTAADL